MDGQRLKQKGGAVIAAPVDFRSDYESVCFFLAPVAPSITIEEPFNF